MNNWERLRKNPLDAPEPEPEKPPEPKKKRARKAPQKTHALPVYTRKDHLGAEAELYPLDEFIVLCGHMLLLDKDGEGFLGVSDRRTSTRIRCADAGRKAVPAPCDHVWWYPTKAGEDTRSRKDESGIAADVFTLAEFETMCANGSITDDDGMGYLGNATRRDSRYVVDCDEHYFRGVRPEFTHVWWYNK